MRSPASRSIHPSSCGLVGILYAKVFYGLTDAFHRLTAPRWVKPALGGFAVGTVGLVLPEVLHTGYGWVQVRMSQQLLGLPLWVVLALPFAKIVATGLSIGSGGSGRHLRAGHGGGGFLGAALWRLMFGILPGVPPEPAPFVIVGMMALFGGIAHAPLAVMLMVAEMTGNLSLLAPAMIAVALSTALVGDRTIYRAQLPNRAASPAHRVRLSFPLLSSMLVRDAMTPAVTVAPEAPVGEAEAIPRGSGTGVVVTDADGALRGVVTIERFVAARAGARDGARNSRVSDLLEERASVSPDAPLDEAMEVMAEANLRWAPVVDDGKVVGRVGMRDIVRSYKSTLRQSVRRATALPPETVLFEVTVPISSQLAGQRLADSQLPPSTLVISILRDAEVIFPRGSTQIRGGDRMTVLASAESESQVRDRFAS